MRNNGFMMVLYAATAQADESIRTETLSYEDFMGILVVLVGAVSTMLNKLFLKEHDGCHGKCSLGRILRKSIYLFLFGPVSESTFGAYLMYFNSEIARSLS